MRKVLQQLKQYKRNTFLCIGLTALEVIMEDSDALCYGDYHRRGLEVSNLPVVYRYGALMVLMAFLSLIFGAMAVGTPRPRPPECRPICVRPSTPISRPFPFPILTNSACRAW